MSEKWFQQEYLCEFVEREGAVFSQESIDAALQDFEPMDLWKKPARGYLLSVWLHATIRIGAALFPGRGDLVECPQVRF